MVPSIWQLSRLSVKLNFLSTILFKNLYFTIDAYVIMQLLFYWIQTTPVGHRSRSTYYLKYCRGLCNVGSSWWHRQKHIPPLYFKESSIFRWSAVPAMTPSVGIGRLHVKGFSKSCFPILTPIYAPLEQPDVEEMILDIYTRAVPCKLSSEVFFNGLPFLEA